VLASRSEERPKYFDYDSREGNQYIVRPPHSEIATLDISAQIYLLVVLGCFDY